MLLPLLIAATFEVSGFPCDALAKAAGIATGKPVAIVDLGQDNLRAAKFSWEDVPNFADQMRQIFAFRPATEEERKAGTLGFATYWPVATVVSDADRTRLTSPGRYIGDGPGFEPVKGAPSQPAGTLRPDGEGLSTGEGSAIGPAGPFAQGELHWFLAKIPISLYADKAKPPEVRAAVLAAVGALPTGQPRWTELRTRFLGGFNQASRDALSEPKNAGIARAHSARLKSWFFGAIPEADLKETFRAPGTRKVYEGKPGSPLYTAAWTYLRSAAQQPATPPTPRPNGGPTGGPAGGPNAPAQGTSEFDPRQPVKLTFGSPNQFELSFKTERSEVALVLP